MPRIMAIDYGSKRCGIAVTDPLQIIASPLKTVPTNEIYDFLEKYFQQEQVEKLVVGEPFRYDGTHSDIEILIRTFIAEFIKKHPFIPVFRQNEMFTSKEAFQSLIDSGVKKKQRRDKSLLDSTSATIILQEFLEQHT